MRGTSFAITISLFRTKDLHELFGPLSDVSPSDLVDSALYRESLRLYEDKLQFGLDQFVIPHINYETVYMSSFIGILLVFLAVHDNLII